MASRDEEILAALSRIALAGDGIIMGVSLTVIAIRTWLRFYYHSKALRKLEGTPLTGIADLRSIISEESDVRHKRSHEQESHLQQDGKVIVVRGKVTAKGGKRREDELLMAQSTGEKAVIVERTQTCLYNEWRGLFGWSSDWRGLLGWGSLKERTTVSRRKVPFILTERGYHSYAYVHIDMDDSNHPLPLVTVHHELRPVQASPYTLLQAVFGRGYPVGLLDEEKILPLEKEITAIGLLRLSSDGQPVIKSSKQFPYFLSDHTRDQLVTELAGTTKLLLWTGVVFSSVAVGVLGYAFIRNWHKWHNWRRQRQSQDEQAGQDRLSAEAEDDDVENMPDGELCVVCLMRRRRTAFVPCGHRVCCVRCAQRVEQDSSSRCPVCRQSVNGSIRIYDT